MATPLELMQQKKAAARTRIEQKVNGANTRVYVGMATCEIAAGSKDVMEVFKKAVNDGLPGVYLSQKGCAGRCNLEPTIEVIEDGKIAVKYGKINAERAQAIIDRHIKLGDVCGEWVIG